MDSSRFDSLARSLGAKRLKIELPWDQEPLKSIFGVSSQLSVVRAPEWVELPTSSSSQDVPQSSVIVVDRFNAKRHLSEVSWAVSEDAKLNNALQMWKVIVLDSTNHTKLGATLMQCIQAGKDEDFIFQIVSDVFNCKATSTLRSRASSLLSFGRWKRAINSDRVPGLFPITEQLAYDYLCELRRTKAASSKRTRFLEAVGFAKGLLGADVQSVLDSARVKGVAYGGFHNVTKKKNPLSVQQLAFLERMAMEHVGPEGIFAGYVCFIVHCRLRWSDGQYCAAEPWVDISEGRGFIEASLYHHKTAKKRRRQIGRLLPVAGVLPGISGLLWAVEWLQHRKELNVQASREVPTMPAPIAAGGWSLRPLTSSEELLAPCTPQMLKDIATHSCKCTILSWMSKANTPLSLRRLAGYHVKPGDKSALEYSRDAAAPILRQIDGIMLAIRSGQFDPDAERSGRWIGCETIDEAISLAANAKMYWDIGYNHQCASDEDGEPLGCWEASLKGLVKSADDNFGFDLVDTGYIISGSKGASCELPDDTPLSFFKPSGTKSSEAREFHIEPEPIHSDSDSLSGWSSSSESDAESGLSESDRRDEIEGRINASDLVLPSDLSSKRCFQHVKSMKFHFVDKTSEEHEIFRCGRRVNANYRRVTAAPAFTMHGCLTCFGVRSGPNDHDPE
eukprot:Skav209930  [mRNA]  locus=scaffold1253:288684:290711:+ [translate_table: standard]